MQAIQFSQTILFQAIQFSIILQFSSIWLIDRTLSGATTSGLSGPGSDGNEGVLRIPQSSSITWASPSDCLISYPGHSLVGSYPSAEKQSVYSTSPADWAISWGVFSAIIDDATFAKKTGTPYYVLDIYWLNFLLLEIVQTVKHLIESVNNISYFDWCPIKLRNSGIPVFRNRGIHVAPNKFGDSFNHFYRDIYNRSKLIYS